MRQLKYLLTSVLAKSQHTYFVVALGYSAAVVGAAQCCMLRAVNASQ